MLRESLRRESRSALIEWNNTFPLDREYRIKYNIGFNTLAHRELNQIDIYFDWLEDSIFADHYKDVLLQKENAKLLEGGTWLKDQIVQNSTEEDALFDKIKF